LRAIAGQGHTPAEPPDLRRRLPSDCFVSPIRHFAKWYKVRMHYLAILIFCKNFLLLLQQQLKTGIIDRQYEFSTKMRKSPWYTGGH
jgi:hypothetical protein